MNHASLSQSFHETVVAAATAAEPAYGMTTGRVAPSITALLALGAVVIGAIAFARRRGGGRALALTALVLGMATAGAGAFLALTAGGAPGTGNGIVASVGAIVLGALATGLGRLSARTGTARP